MVIAAGPVGVPTTFGEAAEATVGAGVRTGAGRVGTRTGVADGSTKVSADVGCFAGPSTIVSAVDIVGDFLGAPVAIVVFETGKPVTGTLFNAARNASALWNLSPGSFAMAIMIISFNAAGRSLRSVIGAAGISFKCAVISE